MHERVSLRLKSLLDFQLVTEYGHIYDLCCDHGQIGVLFANKYSNSKITFIDQKEHLIKKLRTNLEDSYITSRFNYITNSIFNEKYENDSLLILSGIGGHLIIKFLTQLINLKQHFHFLISCNQNVLELREFLKSNNFTYIEEKICFDNNQYYEQIYLTPKGNLIDTFNSALLIETSIHRNYLNSIVNFLSIKTKYNKDPEILALLELYSSLN